MEKEKSQVLFVELYTILPQIDRWLKNYMVFLKKANSTTTLLQCVYVESDSKKKETKLVYRIFGNNPLGFISNKKFQV